MVADLALSVVSQSSEVPILYLDDPLMCVEERRRVSIQFTRFIPAEKQDIHPSLQQSHQPYPFEIYIFPNIDTQWHAYLFTKDCHDSAQPSLSNTHKQPPHPHPPHQNKSGRHSHRRIARIPTSRSNWHNASRTARSARGLGLQLNWRTPGRRRTWSVCRGGICSMGGSESVSVSPSRIDGFGELEDGVEGKKEL